MSVEYVFPNLTRGLSHCDGSPYGVAERVEYARKYGEFGYVEVPADFGKCWAPSPKSAVRGSQSVRARFILHTEFRDGEVKWADQSWRTKLVDWVERVAGALDAAGLHAIELHPGTLDGGGPRGKARLELLADALAEGARILRGRYSGAELWLENRTKQLVSDAEDVMTFLQFLRKRDVVAMPCLDVFQVWNAYGRKARPMEAGLTQLFESEHCPRIFHIHGPAKKRTGHSAPTGSDGMPWQRFFELVRSYCKERGIVVNPEVGSPQEVVETVQFCDDMLSRD